MVRLAAEERRRLLVDAALTVMARDGVAAASTRTICAEAKMPQSAFHYAFRSKGELMQQITTIAVSEITATVDTLAIEGMELRQILNAVMEQILASITGNAGRQAVVYELTLLDARSTVPASFSAWQYELYTERATKLLSLLAERSHIRWQTDQLALARMVAMTVDGTGLAWIADRDTAAAQASLLALVDALVALAQPSTA